MIRKHFLWYALLGFVVIAFGVAATRPGRPALPETYSTPPPDAPEVYVLADDRGAVAVETTADHHELIGLNRGGGVAWQASVSLDMNPIGCAPCPAVLAFDGDGGLHVIDGHGDRRLPGDATLAATSVFNPDPNRILYVTRASTDAVNVRVLRPDRLADSLAAPAVAVPVAERDDTPKVEASADGRHVLVVARLGGLRPGERRVIEAESGTIRLDRTVGVVLSSLTEPTEASGCVSDDGGQVAVLVPDRTGLRVYTAAWGAPLSPSARIPIQMLSTTGGVLARCAFTAAGLVVAGVNADDAAALWVRHQVYDVDTTDVSEVFVCATGAVVVQRAGSVVVAQPGGSARSLPADSGGCTPRGDVWIQKGKELQWLAIHS